MYIQKIFEITSSILLAVLTAEAQSSYISIRGKVVDQNEIPISFANILLDDYSIGTMTTDAGIFVLDSLEAGRVYHVSISHLGYETYKYEVNKNSDIEIRLNKSYKEITQVIISPGARSLGLSISSEYFLDKKTIESSPNLIKDVFRTINFLPAVATTDYNVKPRIRGAHFEETAIYFNNFELINPFHIEIGGGVQGFINPENVHNILVLPGNHSVRYTDKLSGVISMSSEKRVDKTDASVSLDLLNIKTSSRIKLSDKVKIQTSLRRGYWDFLVDLESLGADLKFYDIWNQVTYRLNLRAQLDINLLHGNDIFNYKDEQNGSINKFYNSEFKKTYLWSNLRTFLNPQLHNQLTIGYQKISKSSNFYFEKTLSNNNTDNSDFSMWSIQNILEWEFLGNHNLLLGFELRVSDNSTLFKETRISNSFSATAETNISDISVAANLSSSLYGAFIEYSHAFSPNLTIQGGIRISGQNYTSRHQIAPRVNLQYKLNPELIASLAYGVFYQPDSYYDLKSELGQSKLSKEVGQAQHYGVNLVWSKDNQSIHINGFLKNYDRLFDDFRLTPTFRIESFKTFESSFGSVSGKSVGIETTFNKSYSKGSFNIAYAYTKSIMRDQDNNETSRYFNTPHTLSINNVLKLGKNYELSSSLNIRSGFPHSHVNNTMGILKTVNNDSAISYNTGDLYGRRYSLFKSLDLKFLKRWNKNRIKTEIYINVLNVLNLKNIRNQYYEVRIVGNDEIQISKKQNNFFPVFVSPGVKVNF